jgi:hypothetical protein
MGGSPLWLLLFIVVAVAIALALGSIWLAHRPLSGVGQEFNSTISPFVNIVGLVYGALLGFTVVVAWQQFSSAEVTVASEASTLTTMYRQTVGMPEPEQTQMRQLLRKYTAEAAGPEWDKRASGGTSDQARAAITQMYRIVGSQPPGPASSAINGVFLTQLTDLASRRTVRIINTRPRIPPLLWSGLILGGIVLVALTGFLRLGSTIGHAVVSSAVAVLLGLLLCITYSLDHPYGVGRAITSAPFQHAVEVFDAVDRGT